MYRFDTTLIPVSSIFPGKFYTYTTMVHCVNPEYVRVSLFFQLHTLRCVPTGSQFPLLLSILPPRFNINTSPFFPIFIIHLNRPSVF